MRQVDKLIYWPSPEDPTGTLKFGHHFARKLLRYATAVTITCDRPVVGAGQRFTGVIAGLTFNPHLLVELRIASKSRMACGRLLRAKAFSQIELESWHVAPRGMLVTSTAGQYAILMLLHLECDAGIVAQLSPVNLLWCRLSPAYEAVVALDSVDSLQNIDKTQLCRTASHAFTDATRLEEAYQATQILSRLR